jgi:V/A-type H+-transporting ATPase subunit D
MAKLKHTKNELKAQRDALARFERFLPMLQLKKQQLQAEIQRITGEIAENQSQEDAVRANLNRWIKLFSEPVEIDDLVVLEAVVVEEGNIAGVAIPILQDVELRTKEYDLYATPTWFDDAVEVLGKLIRRRVERETLEEQRRRIAVELRITSQRVNLFEKVKIPECKENIRVIKIFLGDEQTAGVVRAKIAKTRTLAYQYEDERA